MQRRDSSSGVPSLFQLLSGVAYVLALAAIFNWSSRRVREVDVEVIPADEFERSRNGSQPTPEELPAPEPSIEEPTVLRDVSPVQPESVPQPEPEWLAAADTETAREAQDVVCEIAVWRGYRQASFYAGTSIDEEDVAVAQSPLFRLGRKDELDESDEARDAHRALCDHLVQNGWTEAGRGDAWYSDRFRAEVKILEREADAEPPTEP